MELQKRLVELRTERGLSQEDLAEKLYVSRQTISNWERGKTYPDINSLLLMATYFDVSLDHLIKGDVDLMKHHVEQKQLKKWLIATGLGFFAHSFLQPLGRFYEIANFKVLASLSVLPIFYGVYRIYKLMKNHQLNTYSQILDFINNRDREKPTVWREVKTTILFTMLMLLMIILGQFLGTLLFYNR